MGHQTGAKQGPSHGVWCSEVALLSLVGAKSPAVTWGRKRRHLPFSTTVPTAVAWVVCRGVHPGPWDEGGGGEDGRERVMR